MILGVVEASRGIVAVHREALEMGTDEPGRKALPEIQVRAGARDHDLGLGFRV